MDSTKMTDSTKPSLKAVIDNPTAHFDSPAEVLEDNRLSDKQKHAALATWEEDAVRLAVASEEGMTGGEPARLDEVKEAQSALPGEPARKPSSPSKAG
jgi:hypothetical protein